MGINIPNMGSARRGRRSRDKFSMPVPTHRDMTENPGSAANLRGPMLTRERLVSLLDYNPETGQFLWREDRGNAQAGDVAGYVKQDGYRVISVDCQQYPAHRLAWLYMTGAFPSATVDHKNRVVDDNRWENLREASRQQQVMNRRTHKTNRSGFKGVYLHKSTGRWCAVIHFNRRANHLGQFDTPEAASLAYQAKARELFGEYAAA